MASAEPPESESPKGDADVGGAPPPVIRRSKPTPKKAFFGRFMLGHLIAYPVGFLTAVAAIPLGMIVRKRELMDVGAAGAHNGFIRDATKDLALTATEAAQVEIVLGFCMWASAATLLLVHLWTLPWAVAAARAVKHPEREPAATRAYKRFTWLTGATFVLVGVAGVIGWVWVLSL